MGGCGVEVTRMSHDGLVGGEDADKQKHRAVVSGTLFVEPRYRRQGVAQRLLREAEGKARAWGCSELMLLVKRGNKPALKLYSKMGYETLPWTRDHGTDICMRRYVFKPDLHTFKSCLPQVQYVEPSRFTFGYPVN